MTRKLDIAFARTARFKDGLQVMVASPDAKKGVALPESGGIGAGRAVAVAKFTGKLAATLDVVAPADSDADRLLLVGLGEGEAADPGTWLRLGGVIAGCLKGASKVTVHVDAPGASVTGEAAANLATGMLLRVYRFDRYKTRKAEDDEEPKAVKVTIVTAAATDAKKKFADASGLADGVLLARELVNEPANMLGPVEFAAKAGELSSLGVKVEVLAEREMKKLGMGALLGVAQGSPRGARLVVMQWNGGKARQKPVAFIGKGVTFDTGGNSMKPAGGMEEMKGDMGGAAAVTGLMHALAARKAKVNAVGIIGLVENSVDGNAQRPGDIVTSMSGQTIEVLNTDAEGRLVLCDALWYCNQRFEPRFMVNLATLTGAIIVSLGHHYAGLFANDDELAGRLLEASNVTGEKLWRMPLGPEYDKMIESKKADMKNMAGGRYGGAIVAAQFLKRFVKETPWAHLDIAGTAIGAPGNDINQSWGTGFGVRLLDRLVREHYED